MAYVGKKTIDDIAFAHSPLLYHKFPLQRIRHSYLLRIFNKPKLEIVILQVGESRHFTQLIH